MLTCALSGEALTAGDAVATPSGHICSKRLLKNRLIESGGLDPFTNSPLSVDDLLDLKTEAKVAPKSTSFGQMLKDIQEEHDSVVLELMDTRQALQETRQELSQALYQVDAAVRVIARITKEKDAARDTVGAPATTEHPSEPAGRPNKKRKKGADLLCNDMPEEDSAQILAFWESSHAGRKAKQKEAASKAPTPKVLKEYSLLPKITDGLPDNATVVAHSIDRLAFATAMHVHMLDTTKRKWKVDSQEEIDGVCALDVVEGIGIAGCVDGKVHAFGDVSLVGFDTESRVVDVSIHPNQEHVVVASENGRITFARIEKEAVTPVSYFMGEQSDEFTAGTLHPDGMIYLAATTKGELHIWDLKSKSLAASLSICDGPIKSVVMSNNGYHIGVVNHDNTCSLWNLRKQKEMAQLNQKKGLQFVSSIGFDDSGTYVAFGGADGIHIVPVKDWETLTATMDGSAECGLEWGESWIVSSSGSSAIQVHGKK